jgi:hypothetical protein
MVRKKECILYKLNSRKIGFLEHKRKRPNGRLKFKQEGGIKVDPREMGCLDVNGNEMVQHRAKWWASLYTVVNLWIP